MKKNLTVIFSITSILLTTALSSCASTKAVENNTSAVNSSKTQNSNSSTKQNSSESSAEKNLKTYSFILNDNCPKKTGALAVEIALKSTIENYNGSISFSFKGTPDLENTKPVFEYVEICSQIKNSMEKYSSERYSLSFNSQKDGLGEAFDFSSETNILSTLKTASDISLNEIWAIYTLQN